MHRLRLLTHSRNACVRRTLPVNGQGDTVCQDGQEGQRLKDLPVHEYDQLDPDPVVLGQDVQGVVTKGWRVVLCGSDASKM